MEIATYRSLSTNVLYIVSTPSPLIKGGVRPSENWVTRGVWNFLLERGDKPEKKGFVTFLLLYSSITFTVCVEKVRFPLLLFGSSVFWVTHSRFSSMSLLKSGIICTFLIHSGSLQKMLTALFNLVWNTQKS